MTKYFFVSCVYQHRLHEFDFISILENPNSIKMNAVSLTNEDNSRGNIIRNAEFFTQDFYTTFYLKENAISFKRHSLARIRNTALKHFKREYPFVNKDKEFWDNVELKEIKIIGYNEISRQQYDAMFPDIF